MHDHSYITEQNNVLADRYGIPKYYKVIRTDGLSPHRKVPWSLPRGSEPGELMFVTGRIVMCGNGIHAARLSDISRWMFQRNFRLYEVELDEDHMIHGNNKVASRAGRLVRRVDFDRQWSVDRACEFHRYLDILDPGNWPEPRQVSAAAAATQMLIGKRKQNVNGMIEQLVAEQQLAA